MMNELELRALAMILRLLIGLLLKSPTAKIIQEANEMAIQLEARARAVQ